MLTAVIYFFSKHTCHDDTHRVIVLTMAGSLTNCCRLEAMPASLVTVSQFRLGIGKHPLAHVRAKR